MGRARALEFDVAKKALIAAMVVFLTAGCAMLSPHRPTPQRPSAAASVTVEEEEPWRGFAADEDAEALDRLPQLWAEALDGARRAGYGRRVAAEELLLVPGAGLPYADPPPGPYFCRVLRLGAPAPGLRPLSEAGEGFCFVGGDRDRLSVTIEAGPRRVGGYLWDAKGNRRLIFLGAQSPHGTPIRAYGDDPASDLAGLLERIGPFRYRLTLASRGEHRLTIIEMRPAEQ